MFPNELIGDTLKSIEVCAIRTFRALIIDPKMLIQAPTVEAIPILILTAFRIIGLASEFVEVPFES